MIQRPTILQVLFGAVVSAFESKFAEPDIAVREKIGKYTLVDGPTGMISRDEYAYGVYVYDGKKYFIKTWYGTFTDARYYALVQEYVANKVVSQKLHDRSDASGRSIRIPLALELYKTRRSASIVYEYIQGKPLSDFTSQVQANIVVSVIQSLGRITHQFKEKERDIFPSRTVVFYFFSLLFHAARAILAYPDKYMTVLKAVLKSMQKLYKERRSELTIAHRDLTPEHIYLTDSYVYVFDWSSAALTLPYYDIISLSIHPKYAPLFSYVSVKKRVIKDTFLMTYLSLKNVRRSVSGIVDENSMSRLQHMYQLGNLK